MKINPNFRDPVTLKALLATAFRDYNPLRADLTGTPNIVDVSDDDPGDHVLLRIEFTVRNKPYAFFYAYADEEASGYALKQDGECGSDDDPDWECCTPHVGWAFIAFVSAIKEGLV